MSNYGCVALNLPSDWNRNKVHDKKLAMVMVGHQDGKADVRLKADEEKRHQFRWVDVKQPDDVDLFQTEHYKFVINGEWDKIETLWNWNAEGRLVGPGQCQLMARDAHYYAEDVAEREAAAGITPDGEDDRALAMAAKHGIDVTDMEGRTVKRKPGRPRKD